MYTFVTVKTTGGIRFKVKRDKDDAKKPSKILE